MVVSFPVASVSVYQGPAEPGDAAGNLHPTRRRGPDQIILRVAGDVAGVTVTLSDGRHDRLMLNSDPTHTGVVPAALVYPRDLALPRIAHLHASG